MSMKVLFVHPSPLDYTGHFLRLEPLGLEIVADAAMQAGHSAKIVDLQVEPESRLRGVVRSWCPDVVAFSCNYIANVPEIVGLAKAIRSSAPKTFIVVGGHSASFVAEEFIEHGAGAIDCVLRGEGEASIALLLQAVSDSPEAVLEVPGTVTADGFGPAPRFVDDLDKYRPARQLLGHRRKYFIGVLDPCASIEFSRGCPWDCNFCSAWTFYGRSYRAKTTEHIIDDLKRIPEPGIFLVDDVAFLQANRGLEIGEAVARNGIQKRYYMETRGDVLVRNRDVFKLWRSLGLRYLFVGLEAVDEDGLRLFRKRANTDTNFEALSIARELGIQVAINIIADPDWDRDRFRVLREWCTEIPEIVNISVFTPYPGTEIWLSESRRLATQDYRLFDIQHAVLPTRLPLHEFYEELVKTQMVLRRKHMTWSNASKGAKVALRHLLKGQTNFARAMRKFGTSYNSEQLLEDHQRSVPYELRPPQSPKERPDPKSLYLHHRRNTKHSDMDRRTAGFVEATRV
jgi:magnesium-protoporphyrin IX monomethyl ester (oxidative) cyclase